MDSYEVAIAGGGPAGAAAAIVLAQAGRRVLLADDSPQDALRIGEGLPPAALALLRDLGVLDRFMTDGHRVSYGNLCAWGADQPTPTDFIRSLNGRGYQLDRNRFNEMLRVAAAQAGAVVLSTARLSVPEGVAAPRADTRTFLLTYAGLQKAVQCEWVIDASGRSACLARRLGSTRIRQDRLIATAMLLDAPASSRRDIDGRTLVEACEDGWWYSALLPSGKRLVAYLTDLDLAERRSLRLSSAFWSKLQTTRILSGLCAEHDYMPVDAPRTVDASTGRLEQAAGAGWLAVGDAALSLDPLSSQGISMALHTGMVAAHAIGEALNGSRDRAHGYVGRLHAIYDAYLRHRQAYYAIEQRWRHSEFWQRRHYPCMVREKVHPQAA